MTDETLYIASRGDDFTLPHKTREEALAEFWRRFNHDWCLTSTAYWFHQGKYYRPSGSDDQKHERTARTVRLERCSAG